MSDRTFRRRPALLIVSTVLGALVAASAAGDSRTQLPGLVAPSPNACLPGTGTRSWCGDGGPATRAKLAAPHDVAVAPDGSLVIADTGNNVIRKVGPDGVIGTLAGNGERVRRRHPLRAVESAARPYFNGPTGISVAPDGSVLVADAGNNAIRRITHDGRVEIVMGGPGHIGAKLTRPQDVVALANGDMLVADTFGGRILRLEATGTVEAVAGELDLPVQIAVMPGGEVLIADRGTASVRIVDPSGALHTIVETRNSVEGVAWTPHHGVVVSLSAVVGLERNTRSEVLRDDPSGGAPTRIAGRGRDGFTGDVGRATDLALSMPRQLAVAPDGVLLIAEAGNDRIRRLGADGTLVTLAGTDRPRADVASVVPGGDPGPGGVPGAAGGCYGRHPRFEIFNFLPGHAATLAAGPRQMTVRVQTSVEARVSIALKSRSDVVRRRVLKRVRNDRVATVVKLRARLAAGRKYVVVMNGRSFGDPAVVRCDRRRVRVR